MEPSAVFDCGVRVKEEPSEVAFTEYEDEFIDEPIDHKNVLLLPFPQDDSYFKLQKYDDNHESEVDDIKIEFECKDEMPSMNSLVIKKIDDYSQNHLQDVKYGDNYNTDNVIKSETVDQIKTELIRDYEKNSNLNFDREFNKVNEKRRNSKKSDRQHRPKSQSGTVHNGIVHACGTCGKTFLKKGIFNRHVSTLHSNITYGCDICGKTFKRKYNLETHIEGVHRKTTSECDICEKTFGCKKYLRAHIVLMHGEIKFTCDTCGKEYSRKYEFKKHIDETHTGIIHACNQCEKTFKHKNSLKMHIDSIHDGIKYPCDACGKKFTRRGCLNTHFRMMHNGINYKCNVCEKTFGREKNLQAHIKMAHQERITTQ